MTRNLSNCTMNIFFLMAILSLTLSGIWVFNLYQKAYDAHAEIVTSFQTIRAANRALLSIDEATINVSAFLISSDVKFIQNIPENIISVKLNLDTVKQLIDDNHTEIGVLNQLKPLLDAKIEYLRKIYTLYLSGDITGVLKLAGDKRRFASTNNIQQIVHLIKQFENVQLNQATPMFLQFKYEADKNFIFLGFINIGWLLLVYKLFRKKSYEGNNAK